MPALVDNSERAVAEKVLHFVLEVPNTNAFHVGLVDVVDWSTRFELKDEEQVG